MGKRDHGRVPWQGLSVRCGEENMRNWLAHSSCTQEVPAASIVGGMPGSTPKALELDNEIPNGHKLIFKVIFL